MLEWDMGHRVFGHEGKCDRLHGHRYKAEVTCKGGLDSLGRVIDFGVIKTILGKFIDEEWDHRTMLYCMDPLAMALNVEHVVVVPTNPTAENIAQRLLDVANKLLDIDVVHVRLWETPNCYVDAYPSHSDNA